MVEKMMILTSSYRFGEEIRKMIDWNSIGMEIVSVEYNGAIGLEQFAYFQPRIVLLDSMVPIIGTDDFVDEMTKVSSDFLVILLNEAGAPVSNIQNIYRVLEKSKLDAKELKKAVLDAVAILNKNVVLQDEEFDTDERMAEIQRVLENGMFSLANLQELRDNVGLNLSSQVTLLLPRPVESIELPYPRNLIKSIRNILNENNGGEVLITKGVLCILLNEGNDLLTERKYENLLLDIRRALVNVYSVQWTFILSNPISLRKLQKEFQEYRDLYDYGFFRSELQIIKKEYIATKSLIMDEKKNRTYLEMILNAVTSGEKKDIDIAFKALYIQYLKKAMNMKELFQWHHTLDLLCYSLIRLHGIKEDVSTFSGVYNEPFQTIEEEQEAVSSRFASLQTAVQNANKKVNDLMYKIIVIMTEEYNGDLSLQSVAEEVNIATTYLSHLFKKEMNQTFSDYLTGIRIVVAKRMLLEHRFKIHEIALEVGFSDNRYFSRVFKKCTGKSPSEFIVTEE